MVPILKLKLNISIFTFSKFWEKTIFQDALDILALNISQEINHSIPVPSDMSTSIYIHYPESHLFFEGVKIILPKFPRNYI